jgi:hypothetical protein
VRKQIIENCELDLGDCREILPILGKVDADPPYGVMLGVKPNNQRFDRMEYASFADTPENVRDLCVPAVNEALAKTKRAIITPSVKNMFLYPKPSHVGAIYYPAASGCNSWGFSNWQSIFFIMAQTRWAVKALSIIVFKAPKQLSLTVILVLSQLGKCFGW